MKTRGILLILSTVALVCIVEAFMIKEDKDGSELIVLGNVQTTVCINQHLKQPPVISSPFEELEAPAYNKLVNYLYAAFLSGKYKLYECFDYTTPDTVLVTLKQAKDRLIRCDSVQNVEFDMNGNESYIGILRCDSSILQRNTSAIKFYESWTYDKSTFKLNKKVKGFCPLIYDAEKNINRDIFALIQRGNPVKKEILSSLILTSVYYLNASILSSEPDSLSAGMFVPDVFYTFIGKQELISFVNDVIEKAKSGAVKAFLPVYPFNEKLSKTQIKALLGTGENAGSPLSNGIGIKYEEYTYHFKLAEEWYYDPSLNTFEKKVKGILLCKRISNTIPEQFKFKFVSVAYIPFNE